MSINKLVSVNNVIIKLMDELMIDHNKYKPVFVSWAMDAEKDIGTPYQYKKKHAVLDIDCCCAELPKDAVVLQRAIMGDLGTDCTDLFNRYCNFGSVPTSTNSSNTYDLSSFLVVDLGPGGEWATGIVEYDIQDNKIVFRGNYDGQKVTIQYLGIELDCDGIPLVGENHIVAITEYCLWRWHRRRIKSGVDLGLARDYKAEWERQCAHARAEDGTMNDSDRLLTVQRIHDPYIGIGLNLVPTLGNWYY